MKITRRGLLGCILGISLAPNLAASASRPRVLRMGRNPLPDFGPIAPGEEVIIDISSIWIGGSPDYAPSYYLLDEREGIGISHWHLTGFHFTCENHTEDFETDAVVLINGSPIRNLARDIKIVPSDVVSIKMDGNRNRIWAMVSGHFGGDMRFPWRRARDEEELKLAREARWRAHCELHSALDKVQSKYKSALREAFPLAFPPAF